MKDSGNDAVIQVKENQKQLLDDCQAVVRHEPPSDSFVAPPEAARGRIEQRQCRVFPCRDATAPGWQPLIREIVEVRRARECLNTPTRQWERSAEIAFYVSTTHRTAAEYNTLIRNHWGIENKNHYVRDDGLREDHSRIRKNPGIMARLRSFSLNVLRANGVSNIAHTLYKNALNLNNLAALSFLYP